MILELRSLCGHTVRTLTQLHYFMTYLFLISRQLHDLFTLSDPHCEDFNTASWPVHPQWPTLWGLQHSFITSWPTCFSSADSFMTCSSSVTHTASWPVRPQWPTKWGLQHSFMTYLFLISRQLHDLFTLSDPHCEDFTTASWPTCFSSADSFMTCSPSVTHTVRTLPQLHDLPVSHQQTASWPGRPQWPTLWGLQHRHCIVSMSPVTLPALAWGTWSPWKPSSISVWCHQTGRPSPLHHQGLQL